MDDHQRMTLYTLSRIEDMRNRTENARLVQQVRRSTVRWVALSIVVLLSVAMWLVA